MFEKSFPPPAHPALRDIVPNSGYIAHYVPFIWRKCIGKVDPGTNQIIPTGRKTDTRPDDALQRNEHCRVLTTKSTLLLDKAAAETGLGRVLRSIFPEEHMQILTCAYYLASEGKALCHAEQWFSHKLPDQRISELLTRITPSKQQDLIMGEGTIHAVSETGKAIQNL